MDENHNLLLWSLVPFRHQFCPEIQSNITGKDIHQHEDHIIHLAQTHKAPLTEWTLWQWRLPMALFLGCGHTQSLALRKWATASQFQDGYFLDPEGTISCQRIKGHGTHMNNYPNAGLAILSLNWSICKSSQHPFHPLASNSVYGGRGANNTGSAATGGLRHQHPWESGYHN